MVTPKEIFLGTTVYIILLLGGLLFSKDAVDQYKEGKTATEVTMEPITPDDLPTITICYRECKAEQYKKGCTPSNFTEFTYEVDIGNDEKVTFLKNLTSTQSRMKSSSDDGVIYSDYFLTLRTL